MQRDSIFQAQVANLVQSSLVSTQRIRCQMARQVPGEPYARINSQEAYEMVQIGDSTVVDVRNPHEWEAGHVEGAVWIPVDDIIPRFDELPGEGNLLFICEVGARSGLAAEYAAAMGADTSRLFNIEDGTPAWIAQGLPHATGA